jgi:hypothetical protein
MNTLTPASRDQLDPQAAEFYRHILTLLQTAGVPFLVGGAYALGHYTGIVRHTKDFDLFIRRRDMPHVLELLAAADYRTEVTYTHWLGKVFHADYFVDLIFSSGNAMCPVDDGWFDHAVAAEVVGRDVLLAPAEEMIWQKVYIMERERFDGADVAHLIRARGPDLDWDRLLRRLGPHWRVLLAHLVLFGFIYPGERDKIPDAVLQDLIDRLAREKTTPEPELLCRGSLLSRSQYVVDVEEWGYGDARLPPTGKMTPEAVEKWTEDGIKS